ncbi:Hypothetical_protein [Hexamita inflata]|uniref:Hypothetical_protein n=1 Tax=Hexamita inflata TaxID=28002 RepID=A0AA86P602_9EUKA|nr:Hypothetical protein HINF_LOCUS18547 [Hexamita inflata]
MQSYQISRYLTSVQEDSMQNVISQLKFSNNELLQSVGQVLQKFDAQDESLRNQISKRDALIQKMKVNNEDTDLEKSVVQEQISGTYRKTVFVAACTFIVTFVLWVI